MNSDQNIQQPIKDRSIEALLRDFIFNYRSTLILIALGLASGLLGGILGIGGGIIIVPGLVFFFGLNQHKAHGTSLLVALFLSIAGVITYATHGKVDLLMAVEMAIGGVIGALIGAKIVGVIKSRTLKKAFCVFLAIIAVLMILNGVFKHNFIHLSWGLKEDIASQGITVFLTGVLTGCLSALLGIGGGMIMIPGLVILLHVEQKLAQGISLAAMMPTAFTGALMHRKMGNVDFRIGKWVVLGAVVGAFVGSIIALRMDVMVLKIIFGSILLLVSALMGFKKQ